MTTWLITENLISLVCILICINYLAIGKHLRVRRMGDQHSVLVAEQLDVAAASYLLYFSSLYYNFYPCKENLEGT
jgi:hypothetical protein